MHITTTDFTNAGESTYHKRELWIDDDTCVSRLYINDLTMRIGSTPVSMAGIGGVSTEHEHRRKGYMRALYEDSVEYMNNHGYCVSALFGIENFYTKWGYASSLADYIAEVKTRDAEAAKDFTQTCQMRPVAPHDMPGILQLYNQFNNNRTGSLVRTSESFAEFSKGTGWGATPTAMLWEDPQDNLQAYAIWDHTETAVKVAEVAAVDRSLYPTLLYALAEQAVTKRCENIKLYLPADHPFAEYVQRFGAKWRIIFPRHGAGMMRIINQKSLFHALTTELEHRITLSPFWDYSGDLTLETDIGTTHLNIDHGQVRLAEHPAQSLVLTIPQQKLMQLIAGYRTVQDVINDQEVRTSSDAIPLLHTLFPKGIPFMYSTDHF